MKSLRRLAGIATLAGLSLLSPGEARADLYEDLARIYNIHLEVIQNLRGNAFNDLTLRGLIKDKVYNLQEGSFRTFLTRYGEEGTKICIYYPCF